MNKMRTHLFSLLVAILVPFVSVSQETTNKTIDSLTAVIQQEYRIPAISVSVIKSDTCYYGIQGTTRFNGVDKVSLRSKFHLGSNSKAFTSFIAMKMVSKGKIDLETTVIELIPELADSIRKEYHDIDLGSLLAHQARVPAYTDGKEFQGLPNFGGSVSEKRGAFTKYVLTEKQVKKGTYSNAGYVIASYMLEKASDKTFEELVKHYCDELGINCFYGFPNKESKLNPWGHIEENGVLVSLGPDDAYKLEDFMLAAGDIAMNILDYSKFIQINLQGLNGASNHLFQDNFEALHFKFEGYSYGWGNSMSGKQKISFHDGSGGTYYCHTILIPQSDLAIVVMTNSAEDKHVEGIYKLRDMIIKNEAKYGS